VIDAHVHLWALGQHGCRWPTMAHGPLFRDHLAAELLAQMDGSGVGRALLVQTQEDAADTRWLLALAAAEPRFAGVVGWAALKVPAEVARLAADPALKGLRPMVQHRAADWYDAAARRSALAAMAAHGLVLDALIRPGHLPSLLRLARAQADLAIVVDHAAKPEGAAGLPAWREAIAPLADRPNVTVKLSGLLTELPPDAVPRAAEVLLALFGPERLIWGSDWPVVTLDAPYADWASLARSLVPAAAQAAVFGGTAARVYRLELEDA